MTFTAEEIDRINQESLRQAAKNAHDAALRELHQAMYGDTSLAKYAGRRPGITVLEDLSSAKQTPRVWRYRCVYSNLNHRERLASKRDRQSHTVETAGRQLLEIIGKNASYKEKHDHKRGEVTATLEVDLTSIFDASVSGRHFTEILAEAQAETRNLVSELLDNAIKALDVRGDYNDDVRADQLREIKDKIEAALTHGEDNMDGSAGGLSGVGL
ncbi:hypothetical protein AVM02_07530 [Brucella anthropi]|uniref:hypothetical protein n=1 Tax=Brucella anthropi TaxID=529 RepID=UPI0039888300